MMRVLVTGSTGFVGREVCSAIGAAGFVVRGVVRPGRQAPASCAESAVVDNIGGGTDWSRALEGVDAVVHLAARAHVVQDSASNRREYMAVNAEGTRALADAAAAAGVRKFVYVSSVKVNGDTTCAHPFRADDEVHPQGPYSISKWLGEKYVAEACSRSGMTPFVVRPPLVYGPGVRANFLSLLRWVDRGWPLPLGAVRNRRSLVSLWNLAHFIKVLLEHPGLARGTWMISDGTDLSTPSLIALIAAAMHRRARLVPVPVSLIRLSSVPLGFGEAARRLCGSLAVDISATVDTFGWRPPVPVEEGIARTVSAYLAGKRA